MEGEGQGKDGRKRRREGTEGGETGGKWMGNLAPRSFLKAGAYIHCVPKKHVTLFI